MNERDQFEEIVRTHQDLAQEVFLRLYRALPHFRGDAKLSTYLYRITMNVAQDERKRRWREKAVMYPLSDPSQRWNERLPHPGASASEQLEATETWAAAEAALQELSDAERTVLVLFHQEERTYEEIARILEMPIGTVRTHLHRGRERLRTLVRKRMAK